MKSRRIRDIIFIILGIYLVFSNDAFGQTNFNVIQCQDSLEVIEKVNEVLLGDINPEFKKNIVFIGDPRSVGYYMGGELLGFSQSTGIVLSTGFSENIDNSNDCSSANASNNTLGGSDADLSNLMQFSVIDACNIEFDVMLSTNTFLIKYIFGSEEYHDWVNSGFNDGFGIFLSGPGINGPYSNNAKNIAIIPGTSTNVSISSLNCGNHSAGCDVNLPGGPNCNLLVDNTNSIIESFSLCAFDGFTIPLTAQHTVQSFQWYHAKLVVGDAIDALWDSGIFIESAALTTDRDEIKSSVYFSIKPNPAKDFIDIDIEKAEALKEIIFYDLQGRVLKRQQFEKKVSLIELPKGILIIELHSAIDVMRGKIIHL